MNPTSVWSWLTITLSVLVGAVVVERLVAGVRYIMNRPAAAPVAQQNPAPAK